jgi:integrase
VEGEQPMNVGNVERYRTGDGWRYRVRWSLPDGSRRSKSFKLRRDADAWLRQMEADRLRGIVSDPRRSRETLAEYAPRWLANRTGLAPRTVELYESQLRRWLVPRFGGSQLGAITVEQVRAWRAEVERESSATTAAKCYRLLRVIMGTAEADGLIPRNPCRVKGAAVEHAPERPLLTAPQVLDLADAIEPRYRVAVLLAAFGGLRAGELFALRVRHVDEVHATVKVEAQAQRLKGIGRVLRDTKSAAGRRTVTLPAAVVAEVAAHVAERCPGGAEAWLLTNTAGEPLSERVLAEAWREASELCGLVAYDFTAKAGDLGRDVRTRPAFRFHDLRHFAGTGAARAGATTRELQARLGHSTARAAMIYQHAAEERDRELAERIGAEYADLLAARQADVVQIRTS